jgi:hypothetical protein
MKTEQAQVRELQKLILDAQNQLDMAIRGLRTLEARLHEQTVSQPSPAKPEYACSADGQTAPNA